jgi:CUG-BP- and ETR3-like factor
MSANLFVRNIARTTLHASLKSLFDQAGTVINLSLPIDAETAAHRGYAFIEMSSGAEAEKAVAMFHEHPFEGNCLAVSRPGVTKRRGRRSKAEQRS